MCCPLCVSTVLRVCNVCVILHALEKNMLLLRGGGMGGGGGGGGVLGAGWGGVFFFSQLDDIFTDACSH